MKTFAAAALRVLLLSIAAIVIYVKVFEHRLIFYPDREMSGEPAAPFEEVYLETTDNLRLHAWWLPAPVSSQALIVSHGNAGNISYRTSMGEFLRHTLGVNVLMYDYRGYGKSQGEPSEAGTYLDIRAALAHVRGRGFAPESVFLMGQSLGTAVTVDLAAEQAVAGVILEAPFTSIAAVARQLALLPAGYIISTKYDSLSKIKRVRRPLAIVHASGDPVIRFAFGRELFEAAGEPKLFFEVGSAVHEGALMSLQPGEIARLREFIGVRPRSL